MCGCNHFLLNNKIVKCIILKKKRVNILELEKRTVKDHVLSKKSKTWFVVNKFIHTSLLSEIFSVHL